MIRPRWWRKLVNPLNLGGFQWLGAGAVLTLVFAALWMRGEINWPWWAILSPLGIVVVSIFLAAAWPDRV